MKLNLFKSKGWQHLKNTLQIFDKVFDIHYLCRRINKLNLNFWLMKKKTTEKIGKKLLS